jgi:hypothetical protein
MVDDYSSKWFYLLLLVIFDKKMVKVSIDEHFSIT